MSAHPLERPFTAHVPELIRSQATAVEVYLLEQGDIMRQQNEELIRTIISVEIQTKLTNGRVSNHDVKIDDLHKRALVWDSVHNRLTTYGKRLAWGLAVLGPILLAVFTKLIDRFWP